MSSPRRERGLHALFDLPGLKRTLIFTSFFKGLTSYHSLLCGCCEGFTDKAAQKEIICGGITGENFLTLPKEKCFHFKMMGLRHPYHKLPQETKKMGGKCPPFLKNPTPSLF